MALIKQAQSGELTRGAVVLNLGDLQRHGQAIIAKAQEMAAAIVADGREERAELIAGAKEVGRTEGLAAGMADGHRVGAEAGRVAALEEHRSALGKLEAGWAAALDKFLTTRQIMEAEARRDVLQLAAMMASRITRRVIQLDPSVVEAQLAEVLALVLRPTRLQVAVNPADRELLLRALPALQSRFASGAHVELVDDAKVERGGCIARLAEMNGGEIDASIGVQLDRIVEAVLPGQSAQAGGVASAGGAGGA